MRLHFANCVSPQMRPDGLCAGSCPVCLPQSCCRRMVPAPSDKAPDRRFAVCPQCHHSKSGGGLSAFQQASSCVYRFIRIPRTVQYRNGYSLRDNVMVLPAPESLQIISTHQPAEPVSGAPLAQDTQCGMRQIRAKSGFRGKHPDPGNAGSHLTCLHQPDIKRRHIA